MKKRIIQSFLLFVFAVGLSIVSGAQGLENLEKYELSNGLTVILNVDHTRPEVFGYMVCKAGGKDDPDGATGMAHYMEHMLFKGTTKLGTMDWEKEKVHIDSIFLLYDKLGKTTNDEERKAIQMEINEQSIAANKYAIPNEFSNIVKKMGGTGLNANTSPDRTVFFNTFPPNKIEAWLELYSHRTQDAVFRGFQSELEVVYEEKNMYTDNFFSNMIEAFQKSFFKVHPYGQQLLIGTVEELKNPSLTKMYKFYKTWYVPNNMALVLTGDFDSEQVKPMIEKAFGSWERKETPKRETWEEKPLNGRELVEVKMSPVKIAMLGFATVPEGHEDELALQVCNGILSNESGSGLLNQLEMNNELLAALFFSFPYYDYGLSIAFVVPKIVGQSLDEAEKLVLDKMSLVKKGEFDDWRVDAIKKELYRQHQESMETNDYRGRQLGEVFARNADIFSLRTYPERINKITKDDVIRVANKYYGDNYLAFYSKMGSSKGNKIEKPEFKPVVSNTNAKSEFSKKIDAIKPLEYTPKYINFDNDISTTEIAKGVTLYTTNNPANDIFSLEIKYKAGNKALPMVEYATQIMNMAYTDDFSKEELKNEIAKIGATYSIYSDDNYTVVKLYGIESELEKALQLVNGLLNNPKIAQDDVENILEEAKANRKIERSQPEEVGAAAIDWVRYGDESDYLTRLTLKEIKGLQADDLVKEFLKATSYAVEVHYVGKKPSKEVADLIKKNIVFKDNLQEGNVPVYKPIKPYSENTVFFINKKSAIQSKVYFLSNGNNVTIDDVPSIEAFNQYFGGGFSGLVLQEIREYRSLAYGAGAKYIIPSKFGKPAYFIGYVGTQADKTGEAIEVFMNLVREMPEKSDRIEIIKPYLKQNAIAQNPGFRDLSSYIVKLKQKGFTKDPAELFEQDYDNIEFDDIMSFYNKTIKNKPITITIVGNKKKLDYKGLTKYGKVINVKEKLLYRD